MGIFRQFPYSNYHDMNMDEIIKICRELQDAWAATSAEWTSYKDFIDNYFANLDVSAEVLAAMRVMAQDGTLSTIINPKLSEYTAQWLAEHITVTEGTTVIDDSLTIAGAAADANVTGGWIYSLAENVLEKGNKITVETLEDGFWSTVNGQKTDNPSGATFKRSTSLIRVKPGSFYYGNINIRYCMYDINRQFIGSNRRFNTLAELREVKPTCIPDNCYYIALFADNSPSRFELTLLDSSDMDYAEYPFTSDKYLYLERCFSSATGTMSVVETLNTVMCAGLKAGTKIYVSNASSNQCVCINSDGHALDPQPVSDPYSNGQIFTIPEGTRLTYFNLYRSHTINDTNIFTDYITIINKGKILAIGDSITWLDGILDIGGMAFYTAWQRQLRKMGFEVYKRGYSGNPFTTGVDTADPTQSIYKHVVTDQMDVTGYDYIILFAGTNDVLYNAPIGDRVTDYEQDTFDQNTFNGAISGVVSYIREHNPAAPIIMVNYPKSQAASRVYPNAVRYLEEMKYNANFWSMLYVDIFENLNVQPYYNFDRYFYDSTHPNFYGSEKIGHLIGKAIENTYL